MPLGGVPTSVTVPPRDEAKATGISTLPGASLAFMHMPSTMGTATTVVPVLESTVESRDSIKALLSYRLNGHPINFYEEIFEATQDSLKNKVGILKVFPRFKKKKIEKIL